MDTYTSKTTIGKSPASFYILSAIYLFVNSLFVFKYALRVNTYTGIIVLAAYLVVAVLALKYSRQIVSRWRKPLWAVMILSVVGLVIAQYSIDPFKLNVDRWSAITNFIYSLFHGIFPFKSVTHLGQYGDPFPLWCLLHIPFYFLKNVGLSIFFGLGLFGYSVYACQGRRAGLAATALILFSPAFIYEVLVRSDLITDLMVTAAVMNLLIAKNKTLQNNCFLVSLLCGLVMCSRLSVAIPLFIWLLKDFLHLRLSKQTETLLVIVCAFFLAFLPFAFGEGNLYFMLFVNPMGRQTKLGSWLEMLIIIPVFVYLAMTWKNKYRMLERNIAYALTFLVLCTLLMNTVYAGLWEQFADSIFDITYFGMAMPFVCTALPLYRVVTDNEQKS